MSRVVYLHIGAPKTGTTYLQDRLARNADHLAEHGVTVPSRGRVPADLFHFRAALDLLGEDWGGPPGHAQGAWDQMMGQVRRSSGTVVISHEILAPARPESIAKAMNDLGDSEVHIVYSARDLGRQLPAAWQESIKQGRRWSFQTFLKRVDTGHNWFHRALDLPHVLNNWSSKLPPERIHVVTVPHERGRDILWHRFCEAFGIDPAWAPYDSERTNRSLGIAETQLIRRLNRRLETGVRREITYDLLIREMLAERELVNRKSRPVTLPPDRWETVEEQAQVWIDWLQGSGVHVIGDVEDLRPRRPAPDATWVNPDKVRPRKELDAALDALAAMTREAALRTEQAPTMTQVLKQRARQLRAK